MSKKRVVSEWLVVEDRRDLRLTLDQMQRQSRERAVYNNRGTRAKDSRSFQGSALCIFLTAVLFNLPLIIVFCPRVYEDRPMIRITRGADYSSPLHPSLTSLGIPLSPLNAHVSVRSKKERNEKKRNPFSNRFFISFGFLMFNF